MNYPYVAPHDQDQGKRRRSLRDLIKEAWHSSAHVHIGKRGITDEVIIEIKRRLKKQKVLKIRILPSCVKVLNLDRREIAQIVAKRCNAYLAGVRGYTFVIYKR